ncbi:MAG TPA: kynureninase [Chitinophagaceae bacterium]|nr:kynureninase [Chitinophagaceae bacterium]
MDFLNSEAGAQQLDRDDLLASFRNKFCIPKAGDQEVTYFLGNSLGLQPTSTAHHIEAVLKQWQQLGVEGFFKGNQPWLSYHDLLAKPLATIVGALPHEVVVMNQLTVNLHLMLVSFYRPQGKRTKILCEAKAFPSDQYMLETHLRHLGFDPAEHLIEVLPKPGKVLIEQDAILNAIEKHKDEIALVLWGGVNYYTGQLFDMQQITEAAQKIGALVGFDLAHAAGNVPLQLHDWNVDFACWCSYKYLNAGPGAVGGVYIHERNHKVENLNRFAGWWGYKKETRFQMQQGFQPILSAEGWALSTPSPLLFATHFAALEIFAEANVRAIFEKSDRLSGFLFFVLGEVLKKFKHPAFLILTPTDSKSRGSQVSLLFQQNGKAVFETLTANHIFADWREPDVIRIAPVPLYNTYFEVWHFGAVLEKALQESGAQ